MTTLAPADATMIEDVFAVSDRLDALLKAAAAVLPKPKFDEGRVLATVAPGNGGLRGALRILIAVEPLIQFCESELLPVLVDGAADLDTVVKREAIVRDDKEFKNEPPKNENEKPAAEVKPEPPKPEPTNRKDKKSK